MCERLVRHGNRSGRTDLFTDAAADAGNLAVFPGVFAQILVGAFDDDRVGALVDANELARALAHARAAGDALALIDLRNAEVVDFYRVKFAHAHAQPARHAAVFALCRRAAARRCRRPKPPDKESVFSQP